MALTRVWVRMRAFNFAAACSAVSEASCAGARPWLKALDRLGLW
jgi:hypothetical protein